MRIRLCLSFVVLSIVSAEPVRAMAVRDVEVTFFAERALKTQVGDYYKPCGTGALRLTGHRTPYYVRASSKCAGSVHVSNSNVSCHFTEPGCSDAVARRAFRRARRA